MNLVRLGVLSTLAVTAAAMTGCGSSGSGGSGSASSRSSVAVAGQTVVMKNIAYHPSRLSVSVGEKVTFVWADGSIPHNVDGASDLPSFSSGSPRTSGSWTFTFSKAGTYDFHCDVHPGMTGTVTVS